MSESKPVHVLETEDKVRRWLTEFLGSFESGPATATFRYGSARMFVDVVPQGDDDVIVKVISCLVDGAPTNPDLFEFIARENNDFIFGRLQATDGDEEGLVDVWFEHNILATYLDQEELYWAVGAVAGTADEYDTILVEKFGGTTTHEDEPEEDE